MNGHIESDDDLLYTPKISSPGNYRKFLNVSGPGALSDDEGGYSSGTEGYYEDELLPTMSSLPEADLYPDLTAPGAGQPTLPDNVQVVQEPTEEQKQEWQAELEKIEGEIATLRQVLGSKIRYASELKKKLGITPLQEMKHDFELGLKSIKDSQTYQKTSAVAKSAAEKTSSVVSGIGSTVSKKLGDIRNSTTFKSMEGKMGSAYSSIKAKVSGSKSEGNFEEALMSDKENNANGETTGASADPLPEEKVPL